MTTKKPLTPSEMAKKRWESPEWKDPIKRRRAALKAVRARKWHPVRLSTGAGK